MASLWANYGPAVPARGSSDPKKPQSRQLLSCTKCRERKCDRTKPCSACCARGHPKECEFVVSDGDDYSPIQQSYELRKIRSEICKLRGENQRLKERLQAARLTADEDDDLSREQGSSKAAAKAIASRLRHFKTGDRTDNLYFGTPGLANIVSNFAGLDVGTQSLTHTMPMPKLAHDMYAPFESMYPFPILWEHSNDPSTVSSTLVNMLPPRDELLDILDMFQCRAQSCYFPHTPEEVTKKEVERFLGDAEVNAEKSPDMLALIFATLAAGLQVGQRERSSGQPVAGTAAASHQKSDVFLAASMHALRQASFLSQPTLVAIQALVMTGPYLTNSGRFLDAWTLFGTTIRLAHSIGLHRNPNFLEPAPPLRECLLRQTLWWWMLHMDQQYSITLGRPLGISGIGDCPPPEPLSTNATRLRLCEFINHYTILARQILSSDGLNHAVRIDELTDKLVGLWDTMPESLQFNESWLRGDTQLPEWPLEIMSASLFAKVQSLLVLLNRQRVERTQNTTGEPSISSSSASRRLVESFQVNSSQPFLRPAPLRGRALVVNSSIHILHTFLFFHYRNPAVLICWTIGQQAFNACMILIFDAWETKNEQNEWLVNLAFAIFSELESQDIHSLAKLAVQRIGMGLAQLNQRRAQSIGGNIPSSPQHQPLPLSNPPLTTDWSGDTVMGNPSMILLEDPGLQSYVPSSFQPLAWTMAGSTRPLVSNPASSSSPSLPASTVPISHISAAPFPVMSSPFIPSQHMNTPTSGSLGMHPRMPSHPQQQRRRPPLSRHPQQHLPQDQPLFGPVDSISQQHQHA